ncbi:hypothetical protein EI427_24545 [Flammeovirga pectinis]|uniref:Uncharacterized protein n=1 Tax=Flammeovirga pectinis TaxID=2494373 RepID=A0A3S9PAW9_9BACT|nr:hypothetical protein [Flammeovirga pectinis]AZQ65385.1 hypothetical protein EI427_24545 [Flammeovirga pectinis]
MTTKKVIFTVFTLQIGLYLLIGDSILEKQIFNEFKEFNNRRLSNKYNVENDSIWNSFYFTSCRNEFFNDIEKVEKIVGETNPKRYKKSNSVKVQKSDFFRNHLEFYNEKIKEENAYNYIRFAACKINEIPFFYTKVELVESFSTHKDYHAMFYNEQMLNYKVEYIWIIFKWVRIKKINETN